MSNMQNKKAQSIVEFTFTMIIVSLLIFGLVKVFQWVGLDLADRRIAHDRTLVDVDSTREEQLNPNFSKPRKLNAVFRDWEFK